MTVGLVSHPGLVRPVNEDSALCSDRVVAVADGLGGHNAGQLASRLAVEQIAELGRRGVVRPPDVHAAILAANDRILEAAAADRARDGMGTTLTGVAIVEVGGVDHWAVFNVGDSRVYRYTGGVLTQLTVDHNEAAESPTAADRDGAPGPRAGQNVVTRSLGTRPAPQPDLWVLPSHSLDRLVICSDGLTTEVTDREIMAVLDAHADPQRAADALLERALSAGGRDNVTVIVVALEIVPAGIAVDGTTTPRIRDLRGH